MKVAFFFPEHLRIDGNSPAYEVYLDKEKRQFITYNSLNQKWCEAKLDRLDWKRRYWYTSAVHSYLQSSIDSSMTGWSVQFSRLSRKNMRTSFSALKAPEIQRLYDKKSAGSGVAAVFAPQGV